ncbi:MAG: hypothetical protein AAF517_26550, partial [Planctomycetota bacterium]
LAPAVGQQITLTSADLSAEPADRVSRYRLLRDRADVGDVDLVVHGLADGRVQGALYRANSGDSFSFQTDRESIEVTQADLLNWLNAGAILTFTAVPPGSGERVAIDRDSDGILDGDELDAGSDPADPMSVPSSATRFIRGDCNGDRDLDLSDAIYLLLSLFSRDDLTTCLDVCDANRDESLDVSDPSYLLNYLFTNGPPPGQAPECEASFEDCVVAACP